MDFFAFFDFATNIHFSNKTIKRIWKQKRLDDWVEMLYMHCCGTLYAPPFNHFGSKWRLCKYCQCASLEHIGHGSSKSRALSFIMCKFVLEIIVFGKVILPNVVSERPPRRSGVLKSLHKDILSRLSPPRGIGQRLKLQIGRWSRPNSWKLKFRVDRFLWKSHYTFLSSFPQIGGPDFPKNRKPENCDF